VNYAPKSFKNILLIRTDRIGDVVLSLPMLPMLRKQFPTARITVMVRSYTKEIVQHHPCVDEVMLWEDEASLSDYVRILKKKSFDVAILPYPRFRLALIAFLAGISERVGTGYRWYSMLFNKKIYEHRKDAKKHEAEYNLNLLVAIGVETTKDLEFTFPISEASKVVVNNELQNHGLSFDSKYVVLHPGSGGSARDWSPENFAKLGDEIISRYNIGVVITGGKGEEQLVEKVQSSMKKAAVALVGKFNLEELGALYQHAKVFVANSTGPLHIASILGTPVIAFYPPITQCSATRWGPYTTKKIVFSADNNLCTQCNGKECQSNVCMNQITVDQVVNAIGKLMNDYA
jgi:heptosyltransferase III